MGRFAGKKLRRLIETVALTISNPVLSDLKASTAKRMFRQVLRLIHSQLPDTGLLLNTVRTQVELVLLLRPQPSLYGTQPGHRLEEKAE